MLQRIGILIALLWVSSPAILAAEKYTLDSAHTTVAFLVDHIGFAKTLGYFSDVEGSFSFDTETNAVSDINIVVKAASVQSDNKARDKHVRNKDFLNARKFPEMVFSSSGGVVDEAGSITLNGQLKLLGVEQPLTLQATLNKAANYPFGHKRLTLGVSARGSLQRSDFGMDYGVANGLVGDQIDLIVEVEAIKDK